LVAEEIRYSYASFPNSDGFVEVFHIIDSESLVQGDVGSKVTNCSTADFYCSNNKLFTFSVPTDRKNKITSWKIGGIDFENTKESLILFRGKQYPVEIIISNEGNIFYYSGKYGLLAINRSVNNMRVLYILASNSGLFNNSRNEND
jgi:hypothetical protein